MGEIKYTKDGLPVVSEERYKSLVQIIYRDVKGEKFGRDVAERLQQENPFIQRILEEIIEHYGEGEFADGVAFGVTFTYELLRNQSAANKLKEKFKE